jgi:L-asparaginase II
MRKQEPVEAWVVYHVLQGKNAGMRAVCQQSEWETLDLRYPGVNERVQTGIVSETEAEKLARGTSGDLKKKGA